MQKKRESPALKHQQQLALYAIAHVREENERESASGVRKRSLSRWKHWVVQPGLKDFLMMVGGDGIVERLLVVLVQRLFVSFQCN